MKTHGVVLAALFTTTLSACGDKAAEGTASGSAKAADAKSSAPAGKSAAPAADAKLKVA
jgi:hypothetical protein